MTGCNELAAAAAAADDDDEPSGIFFLFTVHLKTLSVSQTLQHRSHF